MSEQTEQHESGEEKSRPEWIKEAEEALERAGDSLNAAWQATRDTRMSALESAKQAAKQLGEAIDRGVDTAKERWRASQEGGEAEVGAEPKAGTAAEETGESSPEPSSGGEEE